MSSSSEKAKVKSLDQRLKDAEETIIVLESKINKLLVNKNDIIAEIKQEAVQQQKKLEPIKEEIEKIKDVKTQIFSIMSLFFGIFTFISIDIGFTRSLFSFNSLNSVNILELVVICTTTVVLQGFFFIAIYRYLLEPFLKK